MFSQNLNYLDVIMRVTPRIIWTIWTAIFGQMSAGGHFRAGPWLSCPRFWHVEVKSFAMANLALSNRLVEVTVNHWTTIFLILEFISSFQHWPNRLSSSVSSSLSKSGSKGPSSDGVSLFFNVDCNQIAIPERFNFPKLSRFKLVS